MPQIERRIILQKPKRKEFIPLPLEEPVYFAPPLNRVRLRTTQEVARAMKSVKRNVPDVNAIIGEEVAQPDVIDFSNRPQEKPATTFVPLRAS